MTDDSLDDTQQTADKASAEYDRLFGADNAKLSVGIFYTSDANLGQSKKGYAVPADSVYTKEVWNAAIEAAANVAEINSAADIRRLKK